MEFQERQDEIESRERKIKKGYQKLDDLYEKMLKLNNTKEWVKQDLKDEVFLKINETREWLDEKVTEQEALELWEPTAISLKNLNTRINTVEKRVEKIETTNKPKAGSGKKALNDFIKIDGGSGNMNNIKIDNVQIGDEVYS